MVYQRPRDIAVRNMRCGFGLLAWELDHEQAFLASHDHLTKVPNRALLHDRIEEALCRAKRSAELFCVMFIDPDGIKVILERISGYGVKIAIDDFGTGYSSLGYLKQFPIDYVKNMRPFPCRRR